MQAKKEGDQGRRRGGMESVNRRRDASVAGINNHDSGFGRRVMSHSEWDPPGFTHLDWYERPFLQLAVCALHSSLLIRLYWLGLSRV
jgi:hypothetical protein